MHAVSGRRRRRTRSVHKDWKPVSQSKANRMSWAAVSPLLAGDRESRQQAVSAPCRTCSSTQTGWERPVLAHLSSSSQLVVHKLSKETIIPCEKKLAPQLYGITNIFSYVWQPNKNWHQFLLWSLTLISTGTVPTAGRKHPINYPPALLSISETNTHRQVYWETWDTVI